MNKTRSKITNFSVNYYQNFINILTEVSNYEQFVTIPFGIVGNLFSIFIFTRPSLNKKTNAGLLFTILCLINIFIILYNAIFNWKILSKNETTQIDIKVGPFLQFIDRLKDDCLSWIQALISFDRFISVYFPVKGARIMNKKWVLFSIIFGLLVFITSVNFIRLFYSALTINFELELLIFLIDILIRSFIPCLIIMVLDIMVILRLRRSKSELGASQQRRSKSSRFTINTIINDLIFLIFNIPYILVVYSYFSPIDLKIKIISALTVIRLLSNIYSHLFFILFLVFNRIFRHEFILIFTHNSCFNTINSSFS